MDATVDPAELREVLTHAEPFGPPHAEQLVGSPEVFAALYMTHNLPHSQASDRKPSYLVGRRGAGKTSFLIGTALVAGSTVIRIRSEDLYTDVDDLIRAHTTQRGVLVADSTCHVWETALSHVAMRAILRSDVYDPALTDHLGIVWEYVSSFGSGLDQPLDEYLAHVIAAIRQAVLDHESGGSFRSRCHSITSDRITFSDAFTAMETILSNSTTPPLQIVVDNLEDMSARLYDFGDALSGLFRFVARTKERDAQISVPYSCQFCFPSEVMTPLHKIVANSEKDLRDRLTIRWHAKELLYLASNRVANYLVAYDLVDQLDPQWHRLTLSDLPLAEDESVLLLRSLLPSHVENGLGRREDPIAYILRHTQLVPRHLIVILNEIFSHWLESSRGPANQDMVIAGTSEAEDQLSESVLSSYEPDFRNITEAVERVRNKLPLVATLSELHQIYNKNSGNLSGLSFDEFAEAMFTIGAFGLLRETQSRYNIADFAYTIRGTLRAANQDDQVCIHPLFLRKLHDIVSVGKLRQEGALPVYPFGSDPTSEEYRLW